jgi:hypothetical protein
MSTQVDIVDALRGAAYIRRTAVGQLPETQAERLRWATAIDSIVKAFRRQPKPHESRHIAEAIDRRAREHGQTVGEWLASPHTVVIDKR